VVEVEVIWWFQWEVKEVLKVEVSINKGDQRYTVRGCSRKRGKSGG
jgi:hypothetical protein